MKKYTKPMIVFESFTLSTNIAGDCVVKADGYTGSFHTCGITWTGEDWDGNMFVEILFTSAWAGCEHPVDVDDMDYDHDGIYNGWCYDVPTGAIPIFNS